MSQQQNHSQSRFLTPDAWHSPATYWFWHEMPDEAQIRAQVQQMHDAGFRSFQIQARLAFPRTEFLNADYLKACALAVEEAAKLGMVVGIYDDYNWQTGQAAGLAVQGHDHLRERHLFFAWVDLDQGSGSTRITGIRSATENLGPAAMAWHYENSEVLWTDWQLEAVLSTQGHELGEELQVTFHPLPHGSGDGIGLEFSPVGGTSSPFASGTGTSTAGALVLVSARSATSRLINPLDAAAINRFITVAYEPFRQAVGHYFGTTVQYMFFDQPHAVYYEWDQRAQAFEAGLTDIRSSIPVHAELFELMTQRFGAEASRALCAVVNQSEEPEALQLRTRFWGLYTEFASERFLGALRDWSHAHGLLQSGHEVLSHVGSWEPGSAFANWDLRANFGLDHFGVDAFRDLTAVDAQDGMAQLSPALGDSIARSQERTGLGASGTMVEQYFMTPPEGGTPWSGHWGLSLEELRSTAIRHHLAGMRQMIFHGFYQTHGHSNDHESLANPRFDFPPGVNFEPWFSDFHADYAAESSRLSEFLEGVSSQPQVALFWPLRTIWTHGQVGEHTRHFGLWAERLDQSGIDFQVVDERHLAGLPGSVSTLILPSVTTLESEESRHALNAFSRSGGRLVASGRAPELLEKGPVRRPELQGLHRLAEVPAATELPTVLDVTPRLSGLPQGIRTRQGLDAEQRLRTAVFNDSPDPVFLRVTAEESEVWDAHDGGIKPLTDPHLSLESGELVLLVSHASEEQILTLDTDAAQPAGGESLELADGWTISLPTTVLNPVVKDAPVGVSEGWQRQWPTFSGLGTYSLLLELPEALASESRANGLELLLPQVAGSASVSVNGTDLGQRGWGPYTFTVPAGVVRVGENLITIRVAGSAANEYYAGTGLRQAPEPNGLLAAPVLRSRT